MADANQAYRRSLSRNQTNPLAPAKDHTRSDEAATAGTESHEQQRKKKMKLLAYIAAFVVFQSIVILVFALTVLRIDTPSFKIRSVAVEDLRFDDSAFDMTLVAEFAIKNKNFGHYKYDNGTVFVTYGGVNVGEGLLEKGRAKARKTRNDNVTVEVDSNVVSDASKVRSDISSGILALSSQATVRGKVHLLKVIKRRRTAEMNCTMALNLTSKAVQDLMCK